MRVLFVGAALWIASIFPSMAQESAPIGFSTKLTCEGAAARVGFGSDALLLSLDGETHELGAVASASGARYQSESGEASVWFKGEHARFTYQDLVFENCTVEKSDSDWVARGNEPGWMITANAATFDASLSYGEVSLSALRVEAQVSDGALVYDLADAGIRLAVRPDLCRDDMSGRPYPETVEMTFDGQTYRGCSGETLSLLTGSTWHIQSLSGADVVDGSVLDIAITSFGRLSGAAGCNRYTGEFELTGEGMNIGPLASTRMMCSEALMVQETRFLTLLSSVYRFDFGDAGELILYGAGEESITAVR
ncbi:META domain-containing protein [Celeribacter litoreus]|uniref:META domain-containing protein n=1 Tax=Celeribacter litoreus TaxID=2876714 RepID=UPI001CCD0C46|nr:META domain-containing protein [Celeribacter litoreus]MCA0041954.1 META domain-containing protein [Celeribacter litoreus]